MKYANCLIDRVLEAEKGKTTTLRHSTVEVASTLLTDSFGEFDLYRSPSEAHKSLRKVNKPAWVNRYVDPVEYILVSDVLKVVFVLVGRGSGIVGKVSGDDVILTVDDDRFRYMAKTSGYEFNGPITLGVIREYLVALYGTEDLVNARGSHTDCLLDYQYIISDFVKTAS